MAVSPAPPSEPGGKRKANNNPVPAIPQNTNHISALSTRGTTDRESPRFARPTSAASLMPACCHSCPPLGQSARPRLLCS